MEPTATYFSVTNILAVVVGIFSLVLAIHSVREFGKAYHAGFTFVFLVLFGGIIIFIAPVILPVLTSFLIDFYMNRGELSLKDFSIITENVNHFTQRFGIVLSNTNTMIAMKYAAIIVAFIYSLGQYLITGIYKKLNKWVLLVVWLIAYQFYLFTILLFAFIFTLLLPLMLVCSIIAGLFIGIKSASTNYCNAIKNNFNIVGTIKK